jgi:hypothetical protein
VKIPGFREKGWKRTRNPSKPQNSFSTFSRNRRTLSTECRTSQAFCTSTWVLGCQTGVHAGLGGRAPAAEHTCAVCVGVPWAPVGAGLARHVQGLPRAQRVRHAWAQH